MRLLRSAKWCLKVIRVPQQQQEYVEKGTLVAWESLWWVYKFSNERISVSVHLDKSLSTSEIRSWISSFSSCSSTTTSSARVSTKAPATAAVIFSSSNTSSSSSKMKAGTCLLCRRQLLTTNPERRDLPPVDSAWKQRSVDIFIEDAKSHIWKVPFLLPG